MKLSQKRNCNRCKSAIEQSRPFYVTCDLHYSVKVENWEGIPTEPCYKPLTNRQWVEARKLRFDRP